MKLLIKIQHLSKFFKPELSKIHEIDFKNICILCLVAGCEILALVSIILFETS